VAALLAEKGFAVVAVDNRECGGTGPCPDGFTLTDCALDVIETLDGLGLDAVCLAGISMGGMIAQEVLAEAPTRVTAAALLATSPGQSLGVPPPDMTILMAPSPAELWTRLTGPGFAAGHPDIIAEEAQLSVDAATPIEGIVRQVQAIAQFDPLDRLDGLDVPTLVIHGDHDPLVPYENGVRLAKKLGTELVTLEGAGHALEFERPAEVARLLADRFTV
jgi:3-oxoadipate enol-lactonase